MTISTMSRRRFLAASAAGGAALAVGKYVGFDAWAGSGQQDAQDIKAIHTLCGACDNWCGIKVYTKGGRIWKADGNPLAGKNLGGVCAKGHGFLHELYNPDRVRGPLKRVGPDKFEPISWEQAFKEIGEKTLAIKDQHGPQSIFWLTHPQANVGLNQRFLHALGSPNMFSHGSTCFMPRNIGWWLTVGDKPEMDLENSRMIVLIGRNPAGGLNLGSLREMSRARTNGAKMVVVDPRFCESASLADQWIRIRPGTDLALVLALACVIIEEGIWQKEFVDKYTEGFAEFAAEVKKFTPRWAEEKTTVPAETIVQLAKDLAREAPHVTVHRGYHGAMGTQYKNSLQLVRAVGCLSGLLGNFNQMGGLYFPPKPKLGKLDPKTYPSPPEVDAQMVDGSGDPERYPLVPPGNGIAHAIPELALQGALRAGFVYHSNPLRTNPNPARVISGYKNLELLVSFDYVLSETATIAHYVLPESFYLEQEDVVYTSHSQKSKQVAVRQPVVKPLYDTKPFFEILKGMAGHMGIGNYFQFTLEEYNRAALAPFNVSLEQLKREGVIDLGGRWKPGPPAFKTPGGKLEMASSVMKEYGLPAVPTWDGPLVMPDPDDPRSFRLIHGKQAHHTHARTGNQPYLTRITTITGGARVWMHPDRARALGINDGDRISITSSVGKGRARCRLTEGLHPDCIFLPSGYGMFSKHFQYGKQHGQGGFGFGVSYNDFLPTYFDPVLGHAMANEIIVQVEKTTI